MGEADAFVFALDVDGVGKGGEKQVSAPDECSLGLDLRGLHASIDKDRIDFGFGRIADTVLRSNHEMAHPRAGEFSHPIVLRFGDTGSFVDIDLAYARPQVFCGDDHLKARLDVGNPSVR